MGFTPRYSDLNIVGSELDIGTLKIPCRFQPIVESESEPLVKLLGFQTKSSVSVHAFNHPFIHALAL